MTAIAKGDPSAIPVELRAQWTNTIRHMEHYAERAYKAMRELAKEKHKNVSAISIHPSFQAEIFHFVCVISYWAIANKFHQHRQLRTRTRSVSNPSPISSSRPKDCRILPLPASLFPLY